MANPFYQPGEQRAARVRALFAAIAHRYDLINDLQSLGLHRRWKRRLVRAVSGSPGARVLDLCCGTGDVVRALAEQEAHTVGLDFSEPMLQIASARLRRLIPARPGHTGSVRLIRGDALCLPFPENVFDTVTISYGLRNLADLRAGLREMRRVTRPGGRIGILDFGQPSHALWRSLYLGYLRLGVPVLGKVFCGDASAYSYILESLRHFPSPEGLAAELTATGWHRPTFVPILGGAMGLVCGEKPAQS
jgi:demethylmenaquinone methyltransferase/2-methoxy-6-polyprenyl-1,4-benzoquinol methylase